MTYMLQFRFKNTKKAYQKFLYEPHTVPFHGLSWYCTVRFTAATS